MKVIDLLNKIANEEEEVPKKIKWGEFILVWEELGFHDYKFLETGNHFLYQGFATSVLNDEVEVIEEDKKIEKIGIIYYDETPTNAILHKKIDEIIDYINKEK